MKPTTQGQPRVLGCHVVADAAVGIMQMLGTNAAEELVTMGASTAS
jgi:hypothetical protein